MIHSLSKILEDDFAFGEIRIILQIDGLLLIYDGISGYDNNWDSQL
jgi:hypothetical protein